MPYEIFIELKQNYRLMILYQAPQTVLTYISYVTLFNWFSRANVAPVLAAFHLSEGTGIALSYIYMQ